MGLRSVFLHQFGRNTCQPSIVVLGIISFVDFYRMTKKQSAFISTQPHTNEFIIECNTKRVIICGFYTQRLTSATQKLCIAILLYPCTIGMENIVRRTI